MARTSLKDLRSDYAKDLRDDDAKPLRFGGDETEGGSPAFGPVDEIAERFNAITATFAAALSSEAGVKVERGKVIGKWREAADTFYVNFIVPYYNFGDRTVKPEAMNYIAEKTGIYVVAAQDQLKLSSAVRYFLNPRNVKQTEPTKQMVNRLAMMGAAAAHYGKKPSECIDDEKIGNGSIAKFQANFRAVLDPDNKADEVRKEKQRAAAWETFRSDPVLRETASKLALTSDVFREARFAAVFDDPLILNHIVTFRTNLIPPIVDYVVEATGRVLEGITLGFVADAKLKGANRKANLESQAERIGIPNGESALIRVTNNSGTFAVVWCENGEDTGIEIERDGDDGGRS
jgi:hypothetical protein